MPLDNRRFGVSAFPAVQQLSVRSPASSSPSPSPFPSSIHHQPNPKFRSAQIDQQQRPLPIAPSPPSSKCVSPKMVVDKNQNLTTMESAEAAAEDNNTNNTMMMKPNSAANLEVYKERCRALEAENARLMASQGRLISDFNQKLEVLNTY